MPGEPRPSVLCVGGLDPSGGAGLLADAAAVRATGAHPAAVAAVITYQNGARFAGSRAQDPEDIAHGMRIVLESGGVAAVKTGALGGAKPVRAVARVLDEAPRLPLVVDPVLASTTGGALVDEEGARALAELLIPGASLVTPNLSEAGILAGFDVDGPEEMARAAREIGGRGARAVLVKGGHLPGERVLDVLWIAGAGETLLEDERLLVGEVRGTGCALAAAAAAGLALGRPVEHAVRDARKLVRAAIRRAAHVGHGPRVPVFD